MTSPTTLDAATIAQIKTACADAMREALDQPTIEGLVIDALYHATAMVRYIEALTEIESLGARMGDEIKAAELGQNRDRHSLSARILISQFEELVCPLKSTPQYRPEAPSEHVLRIVEEARRHLAVDLTEFQSPRRAPAKRPSAAPATP